MDTKWTSSAYRRWIRTEPASITQRRHVTHSADDRRIFVKTFCKGSLFSYVRLFWPFLIYNLGTFPVLLNFFENLHRRLWVTPQICPASDVWEDLFPLSLDKLILLSLPRNWLVLFSWFSFLLWQFEAKSPFFTKRWEPSCNSLKTTICLQCWSKRQWTQQDM